MKQSSLEDVIKHLQLEIFTMETRLVRLGAALDALQDLHGNSEPEKPTERVPLFTVSKAAQSKKTPQAKKPVPDRAKIDFDIGLIRNLMADGVDRRPVEILKLLPDIKPQAIYARLDMLRRNGELDRRKGIYRTTSGLVDPAPSLAIPEQSPALE